MAFNNNRAFVQVTQTFVNKTDSTDTLTVKFVNQSYISIAAVRESYPILKDVRRLGTAVGDTLPLQLRGSYVLDISPSSYAFERRVIDLLDRYTPIEQTCLIEAAEENQGDSDPSDELVRVWQTKCSDIQADFSQQELRLSLLDDPLPDRVTTFEMTEDIFTAIGDRSKGKHLPVVLGFDQEVRAFPIASTGVLALRYAYATTFADQFVNDGVDEYFCRDHQGNFSSIGSVGTTTELFGNSLDTNDEGELWDTDEVSRAYLFTVTTATIVTQGQYYFNKIAGAHTTTFEFRLIATNSDGRPDQVVASAKADASDSTIVRAVTTGSGDVNLMRFTWDRTAVLVKDQDYLFEISRAFTGSETALPLASNVDTETRYIRKSGLGDTRFTSTLDSEYWALFGASLTDDPTPISSFINDQGLGCSTFNVQQRAIPSHQTGPSLTDLEFIVITNGIEDDGSGTITGSANANIERPHFVFDLLTRDYNGATWDQNIYDATAYVDTYSATEPGSLVLRNVSGQTRGRKTVRDVLSEVFTNSATKAVHTTGTTPMGVWEWGTTRTVAATLTDEDIVTSRYITQSTRSIINRVKFAYMRRLITNDFIDRISQDNAEREYAASIEDGHTSGTYGPTISKESFDIFGDRILREDRFNWVHESTTAASMVLYFLEVFGLPHENVLVSVPYFKFKDVEPMDIVNIKTVNLPSFFGTSAFARNPYFEGEESTTFSEGWPLKRFRTYRAQVIKRSVSFIDAQYPTLELTCRLITNKHDRT